MYLCYIENILICEAVPSADYAPQIVQLAHAVASSVDPKCQPPQSWACRLCAAQILLWGLKEW